MKSKEVEHDGVNVPVNLSDIHLDPEDMVCDLHIQVL